MDHHLHVHVWQSSRLCLIKNIDLHGVSCQSDFSLRHAPKICENDTVLTPFYSKTKYKEQNAILMMITWPSHLAVWLNLQICPAVEFFAVYTSNSKAYSTLNALSSLLPAEQLRCNTARVNAAVLFTDEKIRCSPCCQEMLIRISAGVHQLLQC